MSRNNRTAAHNANKPNSTSEQKHKGEKENVISDSNHVTIWQRLSIADKISISGIILTFFLGIGQIWIAIDVQHSQQQIRGFDTLLHYMYDNKRNNEFINDENNNVALGKLLHTEFSLLDATLLNKLYRLEKLSPIDQFNVIDELKELLLSEVDN